MLYNLFQLTDYRKEDMIEAGRKYIHHAEQHFPNDNVGFLIHDKNTTPDMWQSRPHFIWKDGHEGAIEELRDRFGKRAITYATLLGDLKMPDDGRHSVKMPGLMYQ